MGIAAGWARVSSGVLRGSRRRGGTQRRSWPAIRSAAVVCYVHVCYVSAVWAPVRRFLQKKHHNNGAPWNTGFAHASNWGASEHRFGSASTLALAQILTALVGRRLVDGTLVADLQPCILTLSCSFSCMR